VDHCSATDPFADISRHGCLLLVRLRFPVLVSRSTDRLKSRRRPTRTDDLAAHIPRIREVAQNLVSLTDAQLHSYAIQLRENVESGGEVTSPEVLESGFAFTLDAIRRVYGKVLHDVQLLGGLVLASGAIAEMATGEGKTLTGAAPALVHALSGRGVHVMTSNSYLAERDCEELRPVFEMLGLTVAVLPEQAPAPVKQPLYDCDIVYGNGFEFGFDYLRDQIALRQVKSAALGTVIRQRLRGGLASRVTMQRGLNFAIVDEADHVMLDDAISPLLIAEQAPGEAPDAQAHRVALDLARGLKTPEDYEFDPARTLIRLTSAGRDKTHSAVERIPVDQLIRPWALYVEAALKAQLLFHRDQDYILHDGEVQIVDGSTGRIMPDRTWSDGLHQAILAKEGLTITPDTRSLARITRQRFLRLYRTLGGMTGTATGGEVEFRSIYGVDVLPIPLRLTSKRQILLTRFFTTSDAKWTAIADEIVTRHATGQPILVGTTSIAGSERLAELLRTRGISFELLNGKQDKAEADVISQAGQLRAITIATNLAGRGTDIKPCPESLELGGLHVICSEPFESHRVDRQLIGRGARQGQPGSAQMFVAADDELLAQHGRALAQRIHKHAPHGESTVDLTRDLRQLQTETERQATRMRQDLLEHDLRRDTILAKFLGERA
jgi:preprotein translocase subunit SecA